jgi:hypothetical protein
MSKTKLVLLSSAASLMVVTATDKAAQAADMPVVKANPVQYVEACTQYGYGWIRYPGTAFCIKMTSRLSASFDGAQRKTLLALTQDQGADAHYVQQLVKPDQQDAFGLAVAGVWGVQSRTQTSFGSLQQSVQYQFVYGSGFDASIGSKQNPAGIPGGGVQFKTPNALFGANMSYSWGPLGNVAIGRFSSEYQYMAGGDIDNPSYRVSNTRTWHGYYQWNSSGTNSDSVGWTLQVSLEDPNGHFAGGNWGTQLAGLDGNPCAVGSAPGCNGFGAVAISKGPMRMFEIVPNIRWLDDDIGSAFAAFAIHNIDTQAVGPAGQFGVGSINVGGVTSVGLAPCVGSATAPGVPPRFGCTTIGTVVHSLGWANLYALHLNFPKTPGNAPFARDYILTEIDFSNGAMKQGGWTTSQRTRTGAAPESEGGLMIDDHDAIAIARPGGGYTLEKEKFWAWTIEYKHFLTSCTDPDWCWNMHLTANLAGVRPGQITANTDWTKGGFGKDFGQDYELGFHWGVAELTWEVSASIMYSTHKQDLGHDPGMAPTPLPAGINKDGSDWNFTVGFARNFGGSVGKNLAGF